jgi:hypothetical protein
LMTQAPSSVCNSALGRAPPNFTPNFTPG